MRTNIDAIAIAAGITKRPLYQHFDSKAALVDAVLADQHSLMLARIQEWAQPGTNGPAAMLKKNLFAACERWVAQGHWRGSGFTRAAIEFADSPVHPARLAAHRHKAALKLGLPMPWPTTASPAPGSWPGRWYYSSRVATFSF